MNIIPVSNLFAIPFESKNSLSSPSVLSLLLFSQSGSFTSLDHQFITLLSLILHTYLNQTCFAGVGFYSAKAEMQHQNQNIKNGTEFNVSAVF